jgi:hypothetical protein
MTGDVWEPFLGHLAGWPGRIVIPRPARARPFVARERLFTEAQFADVARRCRANAPST